MQNIKIKPILILDFGSQYTQLIARRIREMNVYCEIHPHDIQQTKVKELNPCGIILSGGPSSTTLEHSPRAPIWLFDTDIPLLGICYGMQIMALQLGGTVEPALRREYGYAELSVHGHSSLLSNIEDRITASGEALIDVWMSHGDHITTLPSGFKVICTTGYHP